MDHLEQYWHPTEKPYFYGDQAGAGIVIGCPNPVDATCVIPLYEMIYSMKDEFETDPELLQEYLMSLTAHLIGIHNSWLDNRRASRQKKSHCHTINAKNQVTFPRNGLDVVVAQFEDRVMAFEYCSYLNGGNIPSRFTQTNWQQIRNRQLVTDSQGKAP